MPTLDELRRAWQSEDWQRVVAAIEGCVQQLSSRSAGLSPDDLDEVVSRVCEAAWLQNPVPEHPYGWLYRVVRNELYDRALAARRVAQRTVELSPHLPGPVDLAAEREAQDERELVQNRVRAVLVALPLHHRRMLELRYIAGLSTEEVGRFCGIRRSAAVRMSLTRARRAFEELYQTRYGG